jgi:putative ABC transport system substrate-binding protein
MPVCAADVAIVSSSDIIPYNTCIEGIKEALSAFSLQTTILPEDADDALEAVKEIKDKNPRVMIAVGPQAAFAMAKEKGSPKRLFCMILNPDKLFGQTEAFPGVSLNISPALQMQKIRDTLPGRSRIGVFYTPAANQAAIDTLAAEAKKNTLALTPFPVKSAGQISAILESKDFAVDVLLIIPDEQLGSTKIVEYIIKEALRRKIPVVGYNSWFAKNGAVLAFAVDYKGVGQQVAALARVILAGGTQETAGFAPPAKIKISIDAKTAEKLGVQIAPAALQQADEVIK